METQPNLFLPTIKLPEIIDIPRQIITLPSADLPSYIPIVVPPNDLESPEGVKMETEEEENPGMQKINIPIIDFEMPVPEQEILITAGTTAAVSVAATLTATAAFKWADSTFIASIFSSSAYAMGVKGIGGRNGNGNTPKKP